MLASQISGKPIDYALLQMKFSEKRASKHVGALLEDLKTKAMSEKMPIKKLVVCKLAQTSLGRWRCFVTGSCVLTKSISQQQKPG